MTARGTPQPTPLLPNAASGAVTLLAGRTVRVRGERNVRAKTDEKGVPLLCEALEAFRIAISAITEPQPCPGDQITNL